MEELETRLISCFSTVFPPLSETEILAADTSRVEAWDSMSSAILMSVVEEEFGVDIRMDQIQDFVSFRSILNLIREDMLLNESR